MGTMEIDRESYVMNLDKPESITYHMGLDWSPATVSSPNKLNSIVRLGRIANEY